MDADFLRPALEGCVISYLAVRGPLGWLNSLRTIPHLIYEGHEDETEEDFNRHMGQLRALVPFRIAASGVYSDGDCDKRRWQYSPESRDVQKKRGGHGGPPLQVSASKR